MDEFLSTVTSATRTRLLKRCAYVRRVTVAASVWISSLNTPAMAKSELKKENAGLGWVWMETGGAGAAGSQAPSELALTSTSTTPVAENRCTGGHDKYLGWGGWGAVGVSPVLPLSGTLPLLISLKCLVGDPVTFFPFFCRRRTGHGRPWMRWSRDT